MSDDLRKAIQSRVDEFKKLLKSDIKEHGITECSISVEFEYNDKEKGILSEIKYSASHHERL